jgi:hypothetical protein
MQGEQKACSSSCLIEKAGPPESKAGDISDYCDGGSAAFTLGVKEQITYPILNARKRGLNKSPPPEVGRDLAYL